MKTPQAYHDENIASLEDTRKDALKAARFTIIGVLLIVVIKSYAAYASASVAMLASLTDSVGDLLISGVALYSIRLSLAPPDEDHRFGHGKVEGFSAFFEGAILIGAACFLVFESIRHMTAAAEPITAHTTVIAVSAISIVITVIMTQVQRRALKKTQSLALEADLKHYTSDIWINMGAIIAVTSDLLFAGTPIFDQIISIAIAAYIGYSGFTIVKKATDMLMDKELPESEREEIIAIINSHKEIKGMHDLRTWRSGMSIHISFDVELDGEMKLEDAHAICREMEIELIERFPNAEIIIHMDPEGDTYDTRHRVHGLHH
ncbi:MAG: cation transporter [Alphaproteobacteria bacterium]|nr:cation transporter [Alphaproteobacteria bacterium]